MLEYWEIMWSNVSVMGNIVYTISDFSNEQIFIQVY